MIFVMKKLFIIQWLMLISILTVVAQVPTLPYTATFSTSEGWVLNNGAAQNYWILGTSGSNNALLVTDNDTTPTYSYTRSNVAAEKSFVVGDADKIIVSFDLNCGGKYNKDFLKMFLAPPSQTYEGGIAYSWGVSTNSLYAANFSDHFDMTNTPNYPYIINLTGGKTIHLDVRMNNPIDNPDTNSIAKLVFGWVNDYGSTYDHGMPPAPTITNLRLKKETCTPLTGLSVFNIHSHSVELSWNMPDGGASNYIVQYAKDGQNWDDAYITTVNVQDTSVTLTGLQSITKYWVRVARNCGSDTSVWIKQSFTTSCDYIDTLPFFCDFSVLPSGNIQIPACWERGSESSWDPYVSSGALYLFGANTISMPHLNRQTINMAMTEVSFYAKSANNNDILIVGVMTDASEDSTFVAVDTLNLTTTFRHYSVPLGSYTGIGDRVSFKSIDYSDIYVDDVCLDSILSCQRPFEQISSNPTLSSVDLSWTGTESSYNLYYRIKGDSAFTVVPNVSLGNNGVYTLSGLASSTIYQWYVAARCNDGTEAASHELSIFATLCDPIVELPVTWDFEYYNNETMLPVCWETLSESSAIRIDESHSGTHVLRLYYENNGSNIIILPKVENNLYPIDNLQIRFYAKNMGTYSDWHVQVIGGLITNPEYSSTFIPNDTINVIGAAGGSFQEYTLRVADYSWSNGYPAIKFVKVAGPMWLLIDDLTLEAVDTAILPVRPSVMAVDANSIGQTTATLNATINNPGNLPVSAAGFEWKNISENAFTPIDCSVSNNAFMTELTNLTANTTYAYRAFITYFGITDYSEETIFATLPDDNDTVHVDEYLPSSIKLYPNPANKYVDIQCTINNVQLESVEVIDVYGKVVHAIVRANNHLPLRTRINVSGLAGGIYFVRVTTDKGMVIKKFVKK